MILITCGLQGLCCLGCGCLVTAEGDGHVRVTQLGLRIAIPILQNSLSLCGSLMVVCVYCRPWTNVPNNIRG